VHLLSKQVACHCYQYLEAYRIKSAYTCTCTHISQNGWTALYLAALKGHGDVVELLLEAKADPELKTVNMGTLCSPNCLPNTKCIVQAEASCYGPHIIFKE